MDDISAAQAAGKCAIPKDAPKPTAPRRKNRKE